MSQMLWSLFSLFYQLISNFPPHSGHFLSDGGAPIDKIDSKPEML